MIKLQLFRSVYSDPIDSYSDPIDSKDGFTPRKTLYDPNMYPNMANLAEAAGHRALTQFKLTGRPPESITVGGIVFKTPINTRGDVPTVPSVFPIGVSK